MLVLRFKTDASNCFDGWLLFGFHFLDQYTPALSGYRACPDYIE